MITPIKDLWRTIRQQPAFAGLCLVAGAEAAMNATFGYQSYGGEGAVAWIMAAAFLGNEMVKWQAADGFGEAVTAKEPFRAWTWGLVLVACLCISLPAHIGFIGMWRNDVAAKREAGADIKTSGRQQLAGLLREQEAIGSQRPVASVKAEIERECRSGRGKRCLVLEAELGQAERAAALPALIAAAEQQRQVSGRVGVADPQAQVLGWVWSADEEQKKMALAIALAIAMEVMTSFGFIAVGNRRRNGWGTDVAMAQGLLAHPGAARLIEFRAMLGAQADRMSDDQLYAAYSHWESGQQREPLQRGAFFRLRDAMSGRRVA